MRSSKLGLDTTFVLSYSGVMKNMTIALDEDVARWVRIRAAELNTSVSRLVAGLLLEKMRGDKKYNQAMQEYLSQKSLKLKRRGSKYTRGKELPYR